jgi:hypothetical protein
MLARDAQQVVELELEVGGIELPIFVTGPDSNRVEVGTLRQLEIVLGLVVIVVSPHLKGVVGVGRNVIRALDGLRSHDLAVSEVAREQEKENGNDGEAEADPHAAAFRIETALHLLDSTATEWDAHLETYHCERLVYI